MKPFIQLILKVFLILWTPSSDYLQTQIKTTFSSDQFQEIGLTLFKLDKNASVHIDFELSSSTPKKYLDKLPSSVRYHIAIGFIPVEQLPECLRKQYPDFEVKKGKHYFSSTMHNARTELLIDQSTGRCAGVSIYQKENLSHKIIYRYKDNKYKQCLIRSYSSSGDQSFTLNFQDYEL